MLAASDSPLEEDGFEPSVPLVSRGAIRSRISSESPEKTKRPTNPAKLKNMNRYDAWAGATPSSMTNSVGAQRMTP